MQHYESTPQNIHLKAREMENPIDAIFSAKKMLLF